jgi:sirohydrochlorin ferrochelatase
VLDARFGDRLMKALLAVAHGSPDPRAEPVLRQLVGRVRAERAGLTAMLAHLGHTAPDVPTAIDHLVQQGFREIVVVPLLLTAAYHARADLPALLDDARLRHPRAEIFQADVLGPHSRLLMLVKRRLAAAGAEASASVVLGAIGTSSPTANAELAGVARSLGGTVGFAAGPPRVADVVRDLRVRGASQVAIASYVLAPGTLPDRFAAAGADVTTAPLGVEPEVVDVILERYDTAARDTAARDTAARVAQARTRPSFGR